MTSSKLMTGVLSYDSRYQEPITAANEFTTNRQIARQRTASQVTYSLRNGRNQVICSPPGTGKTYSTIQQATEQERTVVLALQTYELVEEKSEAARTEQGAQVLTIESAHRTCPCYTGEYGEELATELKQCSMNPGQLHKLSHALESGGLPCTHGGCPYMAQFTRDFDSYDLVLTTQGMLQATSLIEGRDIVIDEFSMDTYISEISQPRQVVNHYLEFINSPLGVWGRAREADELGEISSHTLQATEYEQAWKNECIQYAGENRPPTHIQIK